MYISYIGDTHLLFTEEAADLTQFKRSLCYIREAFKNYLADFAR